MSGSASKPWAIIAVLFVVTLAADQGSKIWARHTLPVSPQGCSVPEDLVIRKCGGTPVSVINNYWDWQLAVNLGSAFSMFAGKSGSRVLLSVVGLLALGFVGLYMKRAREDQRLLLYALTLIASGAVGNLIDRIWFGGVTDFILWRYKTHPWPIFNVADVVLVVGVGLILISSFREARNAKNSPAAA